MAIAYPHHANPFLPIREEDHAPGVSKLVRLSWLRSSQSGLHAHSVAAPHVLTAAELRPLQQQASPLGAHAQAELDRLYAIIQPLNYVVLLANPEGVVIDHRGDPLHRARNLYRGSWLGGVWAERIEGTNGIGTVIAESKAVTIHKYEHFRTRHASLTCSGAPILAETGEIRGVVCVSSAASSDLAPELAGALVSAAARAIEERVFRHKYRDKWIVAARAASGSGLLLAVDRDRRIAGADAPARAFLVARGVDPDQSPALWTVFTEDREMFRHKHAGDKSVRLLLTGPDHEAGPAWQAIITPPLASARTGSEMLDFLMRPRLDSLVAGREPVPAPAARGGLPPAIIARLRSYVDGRIDQNIDLKDLAAQARLSSFHFARAFKQAEGITPHRYILQRRLTKARELLEQSDAPLAEIAGMVGFADQSHFNRRFRDHEGVTPGEYRRQRQCDGGPCANSAARPYNPAQAGKRD